MARNSGEISPAGPGTAALPRPLALSLLGALGGFAKKKPLGAIGAVILLIAVLTAILAPVIAPFPPKEVHVTSKYAPPGTKLESTGQTYWLGSDQLPRYP